MRVSRHSYLRQEPLICSYVWNKSPNAIEKMDANSSLPMDMHKRFVQECALIPLDELQETIQRRRSARAVSTVLHACAAASVNEDVGQTNRSASAGSPQDENSGSAFCTDAKNSIIYSGDVVQIQSQYSETQHVQDVVAGFCRNSHLKNKFQRSHPKDRKKKRTAQMAVASSAHLPDVKKDALSIRLMPNSL